MLSGDAECYWALSLGAKSCGELSLCADCCVALLQSDKVYHMVLNVADCYCWF